MSFQGRILYDFEVAHASTVLKSNLTPQAAGAGELSVSAGDLVTVTDAGVGQGWVQATDQAGRSGGLPSLLPLQGGSGP
jgi:hypothetical protein